MFQVTFRDILPTAEIVAQVSAAHAALLAQRDTFGQQRCLSVTLAQRGEHGSAPFSISIEHLDREGSVGCAAAEAHQLSFGLRSALSVAIHGSTTSLASREYERRRAASARAATVDAAPAYAVDAAPAYAVGT